MTKCKYADKYKAKRPPKCKPLCDVCKEKWEKSTTRKTYNFQHSKKNGKTIICKIILT